MTKALLFTAVMLMTLIGAGCSTRPSPPVAKASRALPTPPTSNRPADWIGRWHAPDGRFIQIMPTAQPGAYQLTVGDATGRQTRLAGLASEGRLYFKRAGQALALRPGNGTETGFAALADRRHCLVVVPGPEGYCQTPGSADALPLNPGAYAPVTQDCWAPEPTDLVYFDGRQLDTPASPRCATPVLDQTGVIFVLGSQCAATTGATTPVAARKARVTVADDQRFALENAVGETELYKYCPTAQLPIPLRPDAQ